MHMIDSEMRDI